VGWFHEQVDSDHLRGETAGTASPTEHSCLRRAELLVGQGPGTVELGELRERRDEIKTDRV